MKKLYINKNYSGFAIKPGVGKLYFVCRSEDCRQMVHTTAYSTEDVICPLCKAVHKISWDEGAKYTTINC